MSDPRQYVTIQQIPYTSHVGLKITSRSSTPNYTCEYPQRSVVAKHNYARRKFQLSQCGYKSELTKPYQEVGNVALDSKQLILTTLGQEELVKKKEVIFLYYLEFVYLTSHICFYCYTLFVL